MRFSVKTVKQIVIVVAATVALACAAPVAGWANVARSTPREIEQIDVPSPSGPGPTANPTRESGSDDGGLTILYVVGGIVLAVFLVARLSDS